MWVWERKKRDHPLFHSAGLEPPREQNMQLEPQYTVKWSLLELMSVLSLHELKCMLTSACSSLVNTTHLIILSPARPSAEETLDLDRKEYPNKVLAKTLYWKLRNGDAQIFLLRIPTQTDSQWVESVLKQNIEHNNCSQF